MPCVCLPSEPPTSDSVSTARTIRCWWLFRRGEEEIAYYAWAHKFIDILKSVPLRASYAVHNWLLRFSFSLLTSFPTFPKTRSGMRNDNYVRLSYAANRKMYSLMLSDESLFMALLFHLTPFAPPRTPARAWLGRSLASPSFEYAK